MRSFLGWPGTFDYLGVYLDLDLDLDFQLVRTPPGKAEWEVVEDEILPAPVGNSDSRVGWDLWTVHCLHSRHAVAHLQPYADSLRPSFVVSILFGFL